VDKNKKVVSKKDNTTQIQNKNDTNNSSGFVKYENVKEEFDKAFKKLYKNRRNQVEL